MGVFWGLMTYVETIGNITDEAVQEYIKEQAEESRKEDSRNTAYDHMPVGSLLPDSVLVIGTYLNQNSVP